MTGVGFDRLAHLAKDKGSQRSRKVPPGRGKGFFHVGRKKLKALALALEPLALELGLGK